MKELIRTIEIPKFTKDKLRGMFPDYTVTGDGYGWFYKVDETKTVLVSHGWPSLIDDVKAHMAGNGIPEPLTIELIMADFICQYIPDWCAEIRPEKEAKVSAWKMMKKFYRAVEATWHEGQVSQEEAERRAAICATCPKNTDELVGFCVGCHTRDLLTKMTDFMRSKRTSYDDKLKTCRECHCRLALKVWVHKSAMQDEEIQWPEWCWMND
jgi:hypothetical protein